MLKEVLRAERHLSWTSAGLTILNELPSSLGNNLAELDAVLPFLTEPERLPEEYAARAPQPQSRLNPCVRCWHTPDVPLGSH